MLSTVPVLCYNVILSRQVASVSLHSHCTLTALHTPHSFTIRPSESFDGSIMFIFSFQNCPLDLGPPAGNLFSFFLFSSRFSFFFSFSFSRFSFLFFLFLFSFFFFSCFFCLLYTISSFPINYLVENNIRRSLFGTRDCCLGCYKGLALRLGLGFVGQRV